MADERHQPIVLRCRHDSRDGAESAYKRGQPLDSACQIYRAVGRRENPGAPVEETCRGELKSAPRSAAQRVPADEDGLLRQPRRGVDDGPLRSTHVGNQCALRGMRCNLAEERQVLPDRCGEHHQIRIGNGRQFDAAASMARRDRASRSTASRSIASTWLDGHVRRAAKAIDPPISPRPTIFGKMGSAEDMSSNCQRPTPKMHFVQSGERQIWELGVGALELSARPSAA